AEDGIRDWSDWSSDVCSSDLLRLFHNGCRRGRSRCTFRDGRCHSLSRRLRGRGLLACGLFADGFLGRRGLLPSGSLGVRCRPARGRSAAGGTLFRGPAGRSSLPTLCFSHRRAPFRNLDSLAISVVLSVAYRNSGKPRGAPDPFDPTPGNPPKRESISREGGWRRTRKAWRT